MATRRSRPVHVEQLERRDTPSISFRFDTSLDASGFFADPERRAALDQAGFVLTSQLNDSLTAIVPGGANSWTVTLQNPTNGQSYTIVNPTIRQDEIVVYAIGATMPAGQLGSTAATSYTAAGSSEWLATVKGRGQAGALLSTPKDVAPWGGLIAFNANANWSSGTSGIAASDYDLQSVAEHELMHILGFGAGNDVFDQQVNHGVYIGQNVIDQAGAPVAVTGEFLSLNHPDHWADGILSYGVPPIMLENLPPGEKRSATALDLAALADIGWQVDLIPGNPYVPGPGDPAPADPDPMIPVETTTVPGANGPLSMAVGSAEGTLPTVTGFDARGNELFQMTVFDPTVTGGVRVAVADFNADGVFDIAAGTGIGSSTVVRVIDGKTRNDLFQVAPFESTFTGGVYLAAGDITGDGGADLVISAGTGGGPRVRVFGGPYLHVLADFFGIGDPDFRGGARATVADFTGDGKADLAVAAGLGGGPRVALYDGASLKPGQTPQKLLGDFFAADPKTSDGAYLAAGDTDGNGIPDLIASAGPNVTVFDGRDLALNQRVIPKSTLTPITADSRAGALVAFADVNGDGKGDIVTFAGLKNSPTQVAAYSPRTLELLGFDLE